MGVGQHRSPAPPGGSLLAALGEIFVVDLGSGPAARDDHLHGTEGVTVGGKDTQVVAAGDAMPVVDPVIAGFTNRSGVSPRVLTAASLCRGEHCSSVVMTSKASRKFGRVELVWSQAILATEFARYPGRAIVRALRDDSLDRTPDVVGLGLRYDRLLPTVVLPKIERVGQQDDIGTMAGQSGCE